MEKFCIKFFKFKELKTNMRTELTASLTTFLLMAYIIFLNPLILSGEFAGPEKGFFDFNFVFVATIISSAIACFIMGFWAQQPVALSSGMGLNSFCSFYICAQLGFTPEECLGAILVSGILFVILSASPIRKYLVNAVPMSLKNGISAGIGAFLFVIGLSIMQIITDHPVTLVQLGDLTSPIVMLACATLIFIVVLQKLNLGWFSRASIIIGIILFSIIAWVSGLAKFNGVFGTVPEMGYFLAFDFGAIMTASGATAVFSLFFVDVLDTQSTLTAIAKETGRIDRKGNIKNIDRALMADSIGTVVGGLTGTSNVTSYIESAGGVSVGGRSGLVAVGCGVLFLACLFISPLATSIPAPIDGACLVVISAMFMKNLKDLNWKDISEYLPATIACLAMPLTYSISAGLALGFLSYSLIKIFTGQASKVSAAVYIISIASVLYFAVK
tara:strand:- start:104 stop:1432 length:1329 start_codon:yes stop_codon:yes gene_type:complete